MRDTCPICGTPAEHGRDAGRDAEQFRCPRCGPYVITRTALAMLPSRLASGARSVARASHVMRSNSSQEDWFEIDSTSVDDLVTRPLPPPEQQLLNLTNWMKQQAGDAFFAPVAISDSEALVAVVGASDVEALQHLLSWARSENLIELSEDATRASLTGRALAAETEESGRETAKEVEPTMEIVEGHCPDCRAPRRSDVMGEYAERSEDDEAAMFSIDTYRILRCRGCSSVYVQRSYVFSGR